MAIKISQNEDISEERMESKKESVLLSIGEERIGGE